MAFVKGGTIHDWNKVEITSNDIIAGNGRALKVYMFTVWLYLFKKIYNVK